jgi:undecaprenyl-diphosphatase
MSFIVAIILGIVEGLTEFIPVSSTGHMILTTKLLGFNDQTAEMKTFEIVIQLGAILAIAWLYRDKIKQILSFGKKPTLFKSSKPTNELNVIHIFLGIAPALLVGFFCRDFIKSLFSASTVLWALVVGGLFMIFAEWYANNVKKPVSNQVDGLTYKQALSIGLYQCISVLWPGFSRSGSTIAGGMLSGASYKASTDFSFIMAIPIMCAVTGYELLDSFRYITGQTAGVFLIGFIVAFIVAYVVVLIFLKFIQRIKLRHFAIYRFILAALFWLFIMQ